MKARPSAHLLVALLPIAALLTATPARAQLGVQWITEYGTSTYDYGRAITVDTLGQSWVTGDTIGSLGGPHAAGAAGNNDLFLSRLATDGSVGLQRQRGGGGDDTGKGVALVGSNTVFVGGYVSSTIDGVNGGGILLVRYDTTGTGQGTTRFGGTDSLAWGLAGNATNLLVAGDAFTAFDGQTPLGGGDAFLSKRDSTGALIWTRFAGTTGGKRG